MRWQPSQLQAYEARRLRDQVVSTGDGVSDESKLHAAILKECNRRGWIPIHARMDRPTTLANGTPDFLILADGGAVIIVEAKSKTGKLSTDQLGFMAMAKKLDHTIHVVRSLEQFLDVLKGARKE